MADFIPKDKLSKKAKKELARQKRKTWGFSPVTKVVESKKKYNRKRIAHDRYDEYGMGDSLIRFSFISHYCFRSGCSPKWC